MNLQRLLARFQRSVPHPSNSPSLDLNQVSFAYGDRQVLREITTTIGRGERVAVIGPNGAGKSTLFKIIAGVLKAASGDVRIFGGQPLSHICVAYLPQRSQIDWHFPVTVQDVVMMGRIGMLGWLRQPGKADYQAVHNCLEAVKLDNLSMRQIGELSGGQQQRMFIARALAQEAEVILMDEPLNGLDRPSQDIIFQILDELKKQRATVLVATHDLELAAEKFDQVMLLNHTLVGYGPAASVFTPERLLQAYGGHLHKFQVGDEILTLNDTCCEDGAPPPTSR